jgi:type I restriction enzyme S subunit
MNIVTRASLAQPLLKTTPVLIPPEEEQEDIANFLEFKVNTIDQICDAEQKRIDKLYEYRQSLISSVITDNITLEDELL